MDVAVFSRLTSFLDEQQVPWRSQEPMSRHTTFRIGGPVDLFCCPTSLEQAAAVRAYCLSCEIPCFVLGNGSDLLVSDEGMEGVALCTTGLSHIWRLPDHRVGCEAGTQLAELCRFAQKAGLSGLEFAFGIPGTVGGAVFMNAGAYGGEIKDRLCSVTYLTQEGHQMQLTGEQAQLSYRCSVFSKRPDWTIGSAVFQLVPEEEFAIRQRMEELMARRKEKQPLELPSAGSTFKRPKGNFAAALIEQCGLKGFQVGQAGISEKHAGFCVNLGGATSWEMIQLMREVRQRVQEKTGVLLEPEVRFAGRFSTEELI